MATAFFIISGHVSAQHTVEHEPNETVAAATHASVRDSLLGEIATPTDVDHFVIDIPAGTMLHLARTKGNVNFCLYDVDATTLFGCFRTYLATKYFGYPITAAGRYVVRLSASHPEADATDMGPYGFESTPESFSLGSGDPATLVAKPSPPFSSLYRIAAGFDGDVFVALLYKSQIVRVDERGQVFTVASNVNMSGGLAVDGFGNLLVGLRESGGNSIWRFSPTGERTRLAGSLGPPTSNEFRIAVGPDGDIWAGIVNVLWRFDPTGRLKQSFPIPYCSVRSLAVAPTGAAYFTGCQAGIYLATLGGPQLVVRDSMGELAFDRDGKLYLGAWDQHDDPYSPDFEWAHVTVFDSSFHVAERVGYAPGLDGLVFMRNAQGHMTSRLFVSQGWRGRILELQGAASRAPGAGPARIRRFAFALQPATLASEYADTLRVSSNGAALTWSAESATLPPGLNLAASGAVTGTPVDTGTFTFTARGENASQLVFVDAAIHVAQANFSAAEIVDALLGVRPLQPALAVFLDRRGNANGRLDVGDLRAYMRAQGQVTRP